MKKLNKKILLNFFVVVTLITLGLSLVSGFGFSSAYNSRDRPLIVVPGEVKDIDFKLQVSAEEGTKTIKVDLIDDGGVASLIDKSLAYEVSSGELVPVNMRISVPESAVEGDEYLVTLKFNDVTPIEETGTVTFLTSSSMTFKVLIQKPEEEEKPAPTEEKAGLGMWLGLLIVLAIVIVVAIYFIIRAKRK